MSENENSLAKVEPLTNILSIPMNKEARESLFAVIGYLLDDERMDWEEGGRPNRHIYLDVKRLQDWYNFSADSNDR